MFKSYYKKYWHQNKVLNHIRKKGISKNFIEEKGMSRRTKMVLYKTIYRPLLTWNCEYYPDGKRVRVR